MPLCEGCVFFRRAVPPSVLLTEALGGGDATTAGQLTKIAEDERRVGEEEAQVKRLAAARGGEEWGQRPRMSGYCGAREDEGVFLLHEVKNAGGTCRDFTAGQRPARTCATCRHHVASRGLDTDVGIAEMIGRTGISLVGKTGSWGGDQAMSAYTQGIGARRAQEAYLAYGLAGRLPSEPRYLDWCRRYTDVAAGDYVVCALANGHRACPGWEPGGPAGEGAVGAGGAAVAEATVRRWNPTGSVRCGGYGFFLDNAQLVVEPPGAADGAAELVRYDVSRWAQGGWLQLEDAAGRPLPVLASNQRGVVKVRVGDVAADAAAAVTAQDDRAAFRVEPYVFYKHPDYDYQLSYETHNGRLIVMEPPMVNPDPYAYPRVDIRGLPDGSWQDVPDGRGGTVPLRLCRDGADVLAEWVP